MRLALITTLFITLTVTLFGADIPITTNVDATVTFTLGGNSTPVSFVGGVKKSVSLPWLSSTSTITISAVSNVAHYVDTTYSLQIDVAVSNHPAWNPSTVYNVGGTKVSHSGKDWVNGWYADAGLEPGNEGTASPAWTEISSEPLADLLINLPLKIYPTDTAYVPVRGNVAFTLTATPISMKEGANPAPLVYEIPAKTDTILHLPVNTSGSTPISTPIQISSQAVSFKRLGKKLQLSLPQNFHLGRIKVLSLNGRQIVNMPLESTTKNSVSVWNVSTGMYILQAISQDGKQFVQKFHHNSGDLKIGVTFSTIKAKAVLASTAPRSRATTAQYNFTLTPDDTKYNDSTPSYQFVGQLEDSISYYFINPNSQASVFGQLMDSSLYEEFFPNRYGFGHGYYTTTPLPDNPDDILKNPGDGDYDFFTYESLINALDNLAHIKVEVYEREGHPYMNRYVRIDKNTDAHYTFTNHEDYFSFSNTEQLKWTADFSEFCMSGDVEKDKHELAAFLANISHETTGADVQLVPDRIWGLYWREELSWQLNGTGTTYINAGSATYPPTAGQTYHGRGPIQVSWNMNYGQLSEFFYGDKQILLDNPGLLVPDKPEDATVAFMSAIWFWMTPQAPKPSCHDVMAGNWVPSADDIAKNRDESKFGMTINLINGGLECGGSDTDHRIVDRVEYYERYIRKMGLEPEAYCGCANMTSYQ